MDLSGRPVGIFDSGVGGLSVLREIRSLLPREPLLYVADQAYSPYGDRSLEEVRDRSETVVEYLLARGSKAIVVACNSASAAALHHLREAFGDVPFIGMEPAVKPAALSSSSGIVGVLATEATFQGELFASVVDRHGQDVAVIARACPGLAEAIEEGEPDIGDIVRGFVAPIVERDADVIVLGCTHYAFIADEIQSAAGDRVAIIDPAPAIASRLSDVLGSDGLRSSGGFGEMVLETTADPGVFSGQVMRLLGIGVEPGAAAI